MKLVADNNFKSGKFEECIQNYLSLLNEIQNNHKFMSICYSNISTAYFKLKNNEKALEFIKKATKADPQYDKAFFRKGEIEKSMNNYVDAEQSYR